MPRADDYRQGHANTLPLSLVLFIDADLMSPFFSRRLSSVRFLTRILRAVPHKILKNMQFNVFFNSALNTTQWSFYKSYKWRFAIQKYRCYSCAYQERKCTEADELSNPFLIECNDRITVITIEQQLSVMCSGKI